MKLLITGGCGFLGHHLVEHFYKTTAHEIVILDKLTYASAGYDRLRDVQVSTGGATTRSLLDDSRVRVLGCDLTQPITDGVARELGQVDYVIHAAAETHVDNSIRDPLPFLQSNVMGTHHLLWWAREQRQLRRVFLVSTDEVYGPADWNDAGNSESDPFRPANPYAAAKAGGEAVGMAYANTYKLPVTIVNTMNLYGERQHYEKFIPLVIRRCMQGEKVLIHADATKTRAGTRFYLHCRNYASALSFLLTTNEGIRSERERQPGGSAMAALPIKIHVSGEREISNLDLARQIATIVGKPLHYELVDFHSSRPGHDLRYALSDAYIRSMGWSQPVSIDESLERTVRWYLQNQRWLGL